MSFLRHRSQGPNWQAGSTTPVDLHGLLHVSDMLLGVGLLHGSRIWSYAQMLMDWIFDIIRG
jgi:hypothetical protein